MKSNLFKQIFSAALIIAVLVTMIPFGAIAQETATVTPTEGFLDNYDAETEFVIDSIEDWYAVSNATDKTFEGKTVKLGADIDGNNAETPVLFQIFKGTFDGQEKTVKNMTVTGDALIARNVTKGTIKNLKVENVHLTCNAKVTNVTGEANVASNEGYGIICGRFSGTAENIIVSGSSVDSAENRDITGGGILFGTFQSAQVSTVTNCTVDTCTGNFRAAGGGIVGAFRTASQISGCTVKNSIFTGWFQGLGGIFGKTNGGADPTVIGCTVENVQVNPVSGSNESMLGVGLIGGCVRGNGNGITVKDCKVSGSITNTVSDKDFMCGGLLGYANVADNKVLALENNTVNVTITTVKGHTGGLLGAFNPEAGQVNSKKSSILNISDCSVTGSMITTADGAYGVGGAFGYCHYVDSAYTVSISRFESTLNISRTGAWTNHGAGGVIGIFGVATGGKPACYNMPAAVTIEDCYIGGSIAREGANSVGGIFGYFGAGGSTTTVNNVIIAATFPKNNNGATNANTAGLIVGRSMRCSNTKMAVTNCSTTNDLTQFPFSSNFMSIEVNGKVPEKDYAAYSDDSIRKITPEQAAGMVKKNAETGFITDVLSHVNATHYQLSDVSDGKYNVRFVLTSIPTVAKEAGITVTVKDAEGNVVREFTSNALAFYDSLTGSTEYGVEEYKASDYGANRFLAVIITNIPVGAEYTFEVVPYYVTVTDNIRMEGGAGIITISK